MSKELAEEWLKASYSDILVLKKIFSEELITHMTAFHSQQSVEKSLKAILEYHGKSVPKKHDVLMLKDLVQTYLVIDNEDILDDLNDLYIESRYPGSFGLLPNGKPTLKDAREFYDFAQEVFEKVCNLLNIRLSDLLK